MKTTFKNYVILYNFKNKTMGFENQITVSSINEELAMERAKNEISACYGSSMLKKFTFKFK